MIRDCECWWKWQDGEWGMNYSWDAVKCGGKVEMVMWTDQRKPRKSFSKLASSELCFQLYDFQQSAVS